MIPIRSHLNMNNWHGNKNGYALLISVIIMTTILLIIATVATRITHDQLVSSVNIQESTKAQALAEGCADIALLRLSQNPAYLGNEIINIQGNTCTIRPISGFVVEIQAESNNRYYLLQITLSSLNPIAISNWQRVDSF